MGTRKTRKFYAVAKGRVPGIYDRWYGPDGAHRQVEGFPGAVYRGFGSREEARAFLEGDRSVLRPTRRSPRTPDPCPPSDDGDGRTVLYTDGGCIGNPGPGGYGIVILEPGGARREMAGGFRLTTNNRMELTACIVGLESLEGRSRVRIHTDSRYVVNGICQGWAARWRAAGWMRNRKEPAVNPDLWGRLLDLCERHDVEFRWVRGHAGDRWNERCDRLAGEAAQSPDLPRDPGFEPPAGS